MRCSALKQLKSVTLEFSNRFSFEKLVKVTSVGMCGQDLVSFILFLDHKPIATHHLLDNGLFFFPKRQISQHERFFFWCFACEK